jgi:hypothetical protein
MKRVNYLIATFLMFGLSLNVIDGVKVNFEESSFKLELKEGISQTIELPDNPWPDSSALKCRCQKNSQKIKVCGSGNYFDPFHSKCAEFPGGSGVCGEWNMNCVN